jgi:hypothetical protein
MKTDNNKITHLHLVTDMVYPCLGIMALFGMAIVTMMISQMPPEVMKTVLLTAVVLIVFAWMTMGWKMTLSLAGFITFLTTYILYLRIWVFGKQDDTITKPMMDIHGGSWVIPQPLQINIQILTFAVAIVFHKTLKNYLPVSKRLSCLKSWVLVFKLAPTLLAAITCMVTLVICMCERISITDLGEVIVDAQIMVLGNKCFLFVLLFCGITNTIVCDGLRVTQHFRGITEVNHGAATIVVRSMLLIVLTIFCMSYLGVVVPVMQLNDSTGEHAQKTEVRRNNYPNQKLAEVMKKIKKPKGLEEVLNTEKNDKKFSAKCLSALLFKNRNSKVEASSSGAIMAAGKLGIDAYTWFKTPMAGVARLATDFEGTANNVKAAKDGITNALSTPMGEVSEREVNRLLDEDCNTESPKFKYGSVEQKALLRKITIESRIRWGTTAVLEFVFVFLLVALMKIPVKVDNGQEFGQEYCIWSLLWWFVQFLTLASVIHFASFAVYDTLHCVVCSALIFLIVFGVNRIFAIWDWASCAQRLMAMFC